MSDTVTAAHPEAQTEWRDMANAIAREVWCTEFLEKKPEATKEDVAKAWSEVASSYRKTIKLALRRLEKKKGISFFQESVE